MTGTLDLRKHTVRPLSGAIRLATLVLSMLVSRRFQRILLATAVLNISWQIEKHFFIRQEAADLGSLGGFQVSLTNVALAVLYVVWLIKLAVRPPSRREASNPITLPAVIFLLLSAVSLLSATDVTLGVFEVCSILERFLLFLYIVKALDSKDDVMFVIRVLLIGLTMQSAVMLAQVGGLIGDIDFYGIKTRAEFGGDNRVSGTLGSPNPAAAYLAMSMTVAISILLSRMRRADKSLAIVSLSAATLPLLFTLSRGGWLSLLTGVAALLIMGGSRVPWRMIATAAVVVALLVIPFGSAIEARLYGDDNGSSAARKPLNQLAGAIVEDHPFTGVGANNFAVAMRPYLAHSFPGEFLYTVHNTYLLICAEGGVGALIAFVWFLVAIVYQGKKSLRLQDPQLALPALGCAAAVLGFMVQMNFDPFRGGSAGQLLWLLAGLAAVIGRFSIKPPLIPQFRPRFNSRKQMIATSGRELTGTIA